MRNLGRIIFWGALWGICEATIGHFLHIWALPIGWLIWFPLAYGIMGAAYRKSGKPATVFFIALTASTIKLVDLLNPVRVDYVINPAVSILLEGLTVFAFLKVSLARKESHSVGFWSIGIVCFLWRILYVIYISFLPSDLVKISPIAGVLPLARFLLLESIVNSLLIYGVFRLFSKRRPGIEYDHFNPHPVLSLGVLLMAVFVQWKF